MNKWVIEYLNNSKNPLYAIIMNVLTENNPNEVLEGYKNMGIVKISAPNEAFLMDVLKKFELDKKIKEEGKLEGKLEDARNLLKLGVSTDIVTKAIGLPEQEIIKIKKELARA